LVLAELEQALTPTAAAIVAAATAIILRVRGRDGVMLAHFPGKLM